MAGAGDLMDLKTRYGILEKQLGDKIGSNLELEDTNRQLES